MPDQNLEGILPSLPETVRTSAGTQSFSPSLADALVVAHGRPEETVVFERQVVDFFIGAADLLGVPRSVAAIYAIVFASPYPLSFTEVGNRLAISKGSISQGLRVLREVGALKEVSTSASRTELFMPDLELRKLISRFIENRLEKQLTAGSSKLLALSKEIPGSSSEVVEIKRRLKSLSDWHSKARSVLPIVRGVLHVRS